MIKKKIKSIVFWQLCQILRILPLKTFFGWGRRIFSPEVSHAKKHLTLSFLVIPVEIKVAPFKKATLDKRIKYMKYFVYVKISK